MFTSGQLIFAGISLVLFIVIMIFSYRKDFKLHKKNYQGIKYVLFAFLLFVFLLFMIKFYLRY